MLVSVFSKVLLISIMASLLIIIILLVKSIVKEKLSARWHYYIWLLLLFRLVIPYTPVFSVNLDNFIPTIQEDIAKHPNRNIADDMDNVQTMGLIDKGDGLVTKDRVTENNIGFSTTNSVNEDSFENQGNEKSVNNELILTIISIASKIWLFGVLFFIFYIMAINFIMSYKIKSTSVSVENELIWDVLEHCKKLVNIKKDIPVVFQKHIKTPAICGVIKTKMLIPANIVDQLDVNEIRYVVLHELCHFKRKDTMIGILKVLLCILHWFNPLIWYAFYKMKEDREPVCDEFVLSYIKPDERRNYAETLIKVLKNFSENHWVYSTANMSQGSVANMEWRLKLINILSKRSVILGVAIATVTVTVGIAGVLFINNNLSNALPINATDANPVAAIGTNPVADTKDELLTRGKILDRNGIELAVSIPADAIAVNPREIMASGQDANSIAKTLADYLSLEKEKVFEIVTAPVAYKIVERRVDKDTGDKIREWIKNNNIQGIIIDEDSKRVYPNNNLAAQVIGFTGGDAGLTGVELSMEQYLKLKGTNVSADGKKTVHSGANIVLTMDIGIQSIVENALDKAILDYKVISGAAAIVMDPKNGEILAMVSKPDYDPNMPYALPAGVDPGTWKGGTPEDAKVLSETVWRNKNLADTFAPGSIFKIVTSAAGLEEGVIRPDSRVNDFPVTIDNRTINCWREGRPHGEETFEEAFYNSCNPVFVRVAQSLGTDKFYTYVRKFGFYDKVGLELPGEAQSVIHEKPAEIDMAAASFGQGISVTPIQLITAYSAIANGGNLMKPQIIKKVTGSENSSVKIFEPQVTRNIISKETADGMIEMLESTVSKGTGANAYMEGYRIAGKTGTSEKANGKFVASFAGFAPADHPEIAILVILDEPSVPSYIGGATAAPVAGKIMKDVLDYMSKNQ